MQSVLRMGSEPLGFESHGLVTASVKLPADRYGDAEHRLRILRPSCLGCWGSRSGAVDWPAAVWRWLTPTSAHYRNRLLSGSHYAGQQSVSPRYFRVMGEVTGARSENSPKRDRASRPEPVAMVNEALVRQYFSQQLTPLGAHRSERCFRKKNPWRVIVGVVADEKRAGGFDRDGLGREAPMAFLPVAQDPPRSASHRGARFRWRPFPGSGGY